MPGANLRWCACPLFMEEPTVDQNIVQQAAASNASTASSALPKRPRIWPFVAIVAVFWAFYALVGTQDLSISQTFLRRAGAEALLLIVFPILWLANWRISWSEKLQVLAVAVIGCIAAIAVSQKTLGVFGVLIFAVPWLFTLWAACLLLSAWFFPAARKPVLLIAVLLPWVASALIRSEGLDGDLVADMRWRWSAPKDAAFLAERAKRLEKTSLNVPKESEAPALALKPGDWPLFRGPTRNGEVANLKIGTDWNQSPPKLVWKKRVGPAWSSMIIVDGKLFTQEQHDKDEALICCDAATGDELWTHEDKGVQFWDGQAGAGPRATPTFVDGLLYTFGGTGVLNCLDAATGKVKWSRDVIHDTGAPAPIWGYSSSPLVVDGKVIVFAGGKDDHGLVAYDAATGEPAWHAATGPISYSSAQLASINGHPQILFLSDDGVVSVEPDTGKVCWKYDAPGHGMWRAVQPTPVNEKYVLFGSEDLGLVSLDLAQKDQAWTAEQHWTSHDLKPAYNDVVVQDGYIYGLDASILACVDVETGKRKWKGGRYGHGQVLLLPDQRLLLVTSEKGEVALVRADPEKYEELARFQAIEGKTWNHPAIAQGRLYVRNDVEMACYQLPLAGAN
jgi:outer membrane protein assembly factor BamB